MSKFYSNGSIKFHYTDEGKGAPLLFLHGLGADLRQSNALMQRVYGYRKLAFDFRGHGKSVRFITEADANMQVFCKDLLQLVEYLGITTFTLGGISLGAAIALRFTIHHPHLVNRLILTRPAWINEPNPQHFKLIKLVHDYIQKFGVETGKIYFEENPTYIAQRAKLPAFAESLCSQFSRPQAQTAYALLKHLPEDVPFRELSALGRINIPTLIIGTDDDPMHPLEYAMVLASYIADAKLAIAPSRYTLPKEHIAFCQEAIAAYL
nr:alpha/beta fold hydrolase [Cytophagales bacterium]